jgi:DNA-binding transcriptional regulator YdaS (Cro superfamily)
MPLNKTIEQAAAVAGSQTALAKLIDVTPQNLSDIKLGKRACGLKKRIQIAEIAGVDRLRTIFEYFEDSLDATDEYEAQAKATIRAMLDAFPPETDEQFAGQEIRKPLQALGSQGVSWRKRRDSNPR